MEQKEAILLKKKLEKITTGRPWRLWMAIRELNPTYMRKSIARREFDKSIDKIRLRAQKDIRVTDLPGTDAESDIPYLFESLHPLHKKIQRLNHEMPSKALKSEGEWIADELELALSAECYGIAKGLVNYLLSRFSDYNQTLRHRILPSIFETLIAVGEKERVLSLLVCHAEDCPNTDRIASIKTLLFSETRFSSSDLYLPSKKLNALGLNRRIESKSLTDNDLADLSISQREQFESNPQLYLLLHNATKDANQEISSFALNKFLDHYELSQIKSLKGKTNFLSRITFKSDYKIHDGPLVSIIMSAFQAGDTIEYAIESLLNQTYQNIEVLVCDDASPDEYFIDLRNKYSKIDKVRFFRSKNNQGTYNIRNDLIKHCNGELITFQDSDDYSLPGRIEHQVKAITSSKSVACITRWVRVKPNGHFVFFRDQAALRMCVVSLMVPKKIFEVETNYRSVKFGADTEFFEALRQIYGDKCIVRLKAPHIFGLWSARSLTRSNGSEALEDGYRAYPRQVYAQIAFLQRLLGKENIPDSTIIDNLKMIENLREHHGVAELKGEEK